MPLISVIVPIYNVEKYVLCCIESIINQSYKNLEIILINDGSIDSCGVLCDKYVSRDQRIKVIHKDNGGSSSARNLGLSVSTGDYITFVDSDDFLNEDYIFHLYNGLVEKDADISLSNMIIYNENGYRKNINLEKTLVFSNKRDIYEYSISEKYFYLCTAGRLYKRQVIINCRFDQEMTMSEDSKFFIDVLQNVSRIVVVPYNDYYYRTRVNSSTKSEFIFSRWNQDFKWNNGLILNENDFDLKNILIRRYVRININCIINYDLKHEDYKKLKKNINKYKKEFLKIAHKRERIKYYCVYYFPKLKPLWKKMVNIELHNPLKKNFKKNIIITLTGDFNYGNKLQNYALERTINKFQGNDVWSLWFDNIITFYKRSINLLICKNKRRQNFIKFSKKYIHEKLFFTEKKANYIVGSDQVWNNNSFNLDYLILKNFNNGSSVYNSYAASFGIDKVPLKLMNDYKKGLSKIKYLSVREESGKKIAEDITGRRDIEVVLDPTMLLTSDEWDKVSNRPKKLNSYKNKKYILTYFLGDLSKQRKDEINRIANKNNCYVINLLDKDDPFYNYGPSEFLYLEKHAFLICTDSFHASVFAIIYGRPFIVYDREQKGFNNMGSRIDTLLEKFGLENRKYNGKISEVNLLTNYDDTYRILEVEKAKSIIFLKKILDCEVK